MSASSQRGSHPGGYHSLQASLIFDLCLTGGMHDFGVFCGSEFLFDVS